MDGVFQFGCSVQDDALGLHHSALQQRELLLLQLLRQLALAVNLVGGAETHQRADARSPAAARRIPRAVPAAAAGRAGCPAPCCSSASPARRSCGAAEPAVSGSSARPPAPSPSAAAPPSPTADLPARCSAGYRSVGHSKRLTMLFLPRGVTPSHSHHFSALQVAVGPSQVGSSHLQLSFQPVHLQLLLCINVQLVKGSKRAFGIFQTAAVLVSIPEIPNTGRVSSPAAAAELSGPPALG